MIGTTYQELSESIAELGESIDRLREQRDELLAACKSIVEYEDQVGFASSGARLRVAMNAARAAIARAEAPR